jgi:hypothetical protein
LALPSGAGHDGNLWHTESDFNVGKIGIVNPNASPNASPNPNATTIVYLGLGPPGTTTDPIQTTTVSVGGELTVDVGSGNISLNHDVDCHMSGGS